MKLLVDMLELPNIIVQSNPSARHTTVSANTFLILLLTKEKGVLKLKSIAKLNK
jgi:hypothetical protein